MKFTAIFTTAVVVASLNVGPVKAQSDSIKISPSHLAAAKQLILTARGTNARFMSMRKSTIEALSLSIPEKNRTKFESDMTAFLNKYLPEDKFLDITAKTYAKVFTEDELNQLIIFYNSPLGKKITITLPQIVQETMLLDHNLLVEHGAEVNAIENEALQQ